MMFCIPISNPLLVNNEIVLLKVFKNAHLTQMSIMKNISLQDENLKKMVSNLA